MSERSKILTAEEIIRLHKHPIQTIGTFGNKIFIPDNSETEKEHVKNCLDELKKVLESERVERRNVRCEAEWLPELKRAKINRITGNLTLFGYRKDGNIYLLPEEALFLLEMNRLELLYNDIPFSIEQGYAQLLGDETCTLQQYRVFQSMALQNFHVRNFTKESTSRIEESFARRTSHCSSPKKTKLDETQHGCNIYYGESSHVQKIDDELKIQRDTDEFNIDNVSTETSAKLNSLSDSGSIAFYKLQDLQF